MLQVLAGGALGVFSEDMLPLVARLAAALPAGAGAADERLLSKMSQVGVSGLAWAQAWALAGAV